MNDQVIKWLEWRIQHLQNVEGAGPENEVVKVLQDELAHIKGIKNASIGCVVCGSYSHLSKDHVE